MVILQQVFDDVIDSPDQAVLLKNLIRSLESNEFGVFLLVNQTGSVVVASKAAQRLIKLPAERSYPLTIWDILTSQRFATWFSLNREHEATHPGDYEWEDALQALDGSKIPVYLRASWLGQDFYLLHGVEMVCSVSQNREIEAMEQRIASLEQEIATCKREKTKLKQAERIYRNAFNQTFQLSTLLTPEGIVLEDNQTALDFCGLTRDESIGQYFPELHCWQVTPDVKQRIETSIAKAAAGATIRFETDMWDPGQNIITIDFSLKPSFDEAGNIEFLIAEGRDVTERKQVELTLKASESRFRSTLETIPLIGVILDQQANIIFVNDFFLELTGWQRESVLHQHWFDRFVPKAKWDEINRRTFDSASQDESFSNHYEYTILTRWGEERLISWRSTPLDGPNHSTAELALIGEDITERRRGERSLQQHAVQEQLLADITHQVRQSLDLDTILKTAVNQIQQALRAEQVLVFQLDMNGGGEILAASDAGQGAVRLSNPQFSQRLRQRLVVPPGRGPQMVDAPIVRTLNSGERQVWGLLIVHLNYRVNDFIEVEWFLKQLADQLAVAIHQSELYRQAQTELVTRQQAADRFRHDALHDALTGLPNYPCLLEHLNDLLPADTPTSEVDQFAVLFLDLNDFKAINDSFGHSTGDQLLRVVAQRLRTCIRETDLVARRSGDEFLFLLHPIDGPREAIEVARRVRQALKQPISFGQQRLTVSGSIGIVLGPQDYTTAESILQDADKAMYEAKGSAIDHYLWPHTAESQDQTQDLH
jgi:diguanylate cyclase (GGDEF)-like protein/PAS domain S-box-containing protein